MAIRPKKREDGSLMEFRERIEIEDPKHLDRQMSRLRNEALSQNKKISVKLVEGKDMHIEIWE